MFNRHANVENTDEVLLSYEPWNRYKALVMNDVKQGTKVKHATGVLYPMLSENKTVFDGESPSDFREGGVVYMANISHHLNQGGLNSQDGVLEGRAEKVTDFYESLGNILKEVNAKVFKKSDVEVETDSSVVIKDGSKLHRLDGSIAFNLGHKPKGLDFLELLQVEGSPDLTELVDLVPKQGYNQALELSDLLFKEGNTQTDKLDRLMTIMYGGKTVDVAKASYVKQVFETIQDLLVKGNKIEVVSFDADMVKSDVCTLVGYGWLDKIGANVKNVDIGSVDGFDTPDKVKVYTYLDKVVNTDKTSVLFYSSDGINTFNNSAVVGYSDDSSKLDQSVAVSRADLTKISLPSKMAFEGDVLHHLDAEVFNEGGGSYEEFEESTSFRSGGGDIHDLLNPLATDQVYYSILDEFEGLAKLPDIGYLSKTNVSTRFNNDNDDLSTLDINVYKHVHGERDKSKTDNVKVVSEGGSTKIDQGSYKTLGEFSENFSQSAVANEARIGKPDIELSTSTIETRGIPSTESASAFAGGVGTVAELGTSESIVLGYTEKHDVDKASVSSEGEMTSQTLSETVWSGDLSDGFIDKGTLRNVGMVVDIVKSNNIPLKEGELDLSDTYLTTVSYGGVDKTSNVNSSVFHVNNLNVVTGQGGSEGVYHDLDQSNTSAISVGELEENVDSSRPYGEGERGDSVEEVEGNRYGVESKQMLSTDSKITLGEETVFDDVLSVSQGDQFGSSFDLTTLTSLGEELEVSEVTSSQEGENQEVVRATKGNTLATMDGAVDGKTFSEGADFSRTEETRTVSNADIVFDVEAPFGSTSGELHNNVYALNYTSGDTVSTTDETFLTNYGNTLDKIEEPSKAILGAEEVSVIELNLLAKYGAVEELEESTTLDYGENDVLDNIHAAVVRGTIEETFSNSLSMTYGDVGYYRDVDSIVNYSDLVDYTETDAVVVGEGSTNVTESVKITNGTEEDGVELSRLINYSELFGVEETTTYFTGLGIDETDLLELRSRLGDMSEVAYSDKVNLQGLLSGLDSTSGSVSLASSDELKEGSETTVYGDIGKTLGVVDVQYSLPTLGIETTDVVKSGDEDVLEFSTNFLKFVLDTTVTSSANISIGEYPEQSLVFDPVVDGWIDEVGATTLEHTLGEVLNINGAELYHNYGDVVNTATPTTVTEGVTDKLDELSPHFYGSALDKLELPYAITLASVEEVVNTDYEKVYFGENNTLHRGASLQYGTSDYADNGDTYYQGDRDRTDQGSYKKLGEIAETVSDVSTSVEGEHGNLEGLLRDPGYGEVVEMEETAYHQYAETTRQDTTSYGILYGRLGKGSQGYRHTLGLLETMEEPEAFVKFSVADFNDEEVSSEGIFYGDLGETNVTNNLYEGDMEILYNSSLPIDYSEIAEVGKASYTIAYADYVETEQSHTYNYGAEGSADVGSHYTEGGLEGISNATDMPEYGNVANGFDTAISEEIHGQMSGLDSGDMMEVYGGIDKVLEGLFFEIGTQSHSAKALRGSYLEGEKDKFEGVSYNRLGEVQEIMDDGYGTELGELSEYSTVKNIPSREGTTTEIYKFTKHDIVYGDTFTYYSQGIKHSLGDSVGNQELATYYSDGVNVNLEVSQPNPTYGDLDYTRETTLNKGGELLETVATTTDKVFQMTLSKITKTFKKLGEGEVLDISSVNTYNQVDGTLDTLESVDGWGEGDILIPSLANTSDQVYGILDRLDKAGTGEGVLGDIVDLTSINTEKVVYSEFVATDSASIDYNHADLVEVDSAGGFAGSVKADVVRLDNANANAIISTKLDETVAVQNAYNYAHDFSALDEFNLPDDFSTCDVEVEDTDSFGTIAQDSFADVVEMLDEVGDFVDMQDVYLEDAEVVQPSTETLEVLLERETLSTIDKDFDVQLYSTDLGEPGTTEQDMFMSDAELGEYSNTVQDVALSNEELSDYLSDLEEVEVMDNSLGNLSNSMVDITLEGSNLADISHLYYDVNIEEEVAALPDETPNDVDVHLYENGVVSEQPTDVYVDYYDLGNTEEQTQDVQVSEIDLGATSKETLDVSLDGTEMAESEGTVDIDVEEFEVASNEGDVVDIDVETVYSATPNEEGVDVVVDYSTISSLDDVVDVDIETDDVAVTDVDLDVLLEGFDLTTVDDVSDLILEDSVLASTDGNLDVTLETEDLAFGGETTDVVVNEEDVATTDASTDVVLDSEPDLASSLDTFHEVLLNDFEGFDLSRSKRISIEKDTAAFKQVYSNDLFIDEDAPFERSRDTDLSIEEDATFERSRETSIAIEDDTMFERSRDTSITIEEIDLSSKSRDSIASIEEDTTFERSKNKVISIEEDDLASKTRETSVAIEEDAAFERSQNTNIFISEGEESSKSVGRDISVFADDEGIYSNSHIIDVSDADEFVRGITRDIVVDGVSDATKNREFIMEDTFEDVGDLRREREIDHSGDSEEGVGQLPTPPPWKEEKETKKVWLIMGKPYPAWNGWNIKKTR